MKVNILDVFIDRFNKKEALEKIESFLKSNNQAYIVTPNPEFLIASQKDEIFKSILNKADLSIPDGIGLIFASWFLGKPFKERITGVDLIWDIAKIAKENNYSIYLLGGKEGIAEKAKKRLEKYFPGLKIIGAESGGVINDQGKGDEEIVIRINKVGPDILLAAFGQIKQEKWICRNLKKMPAVKIAMGVGGSLDFLAGKAIRAPLFLQRLGLEWLWRLIQEPQRWKRIYTAVIKFPFKVIVFRIKKYF